MISQKYPLLLQNCTGVILITKPPLIFGSPEGGFYDFLGYSLCIGACFMSALGLVLTKLIALTVG